jgi:hypothetical protein
VAPTETAARSPPLRASAEGFGGDLFELVLGESDVLGVRAARRLVETIV